MILRDEEDDKERVRRCEDFNIIFSRLAPIFGQTSPLSAAQHRQGQIQIKSPAQPVAYSISLLACICLQSSSLHALVDAMSTFYKLLGVFDDRPCL